MSIFLFAFLVAQNMTRDILEGSYNSSPISVYLDEFPIRMFGLLYRRMIISRGAFVNGCY